MKVAFATGTGIESAWMNTLRLCRDRSQLHRHDSERGPAFDLPGLTLHIAHPDPAERPRYYAFPHLIDAYLARLFGADRERSLTYSRLHRWDAADGRQIDQVLTALSSLRANPSTRTAVFALWQPEVDPISSYPISPVAGSFRVFDAALHLMVVARSVDLWVGTVPELVALAQLLEECAEKLHLTPGGLIYHAWSAHIYEMDWLAHIATQDFEPWN